MTYIGAPMIYYGDEVRMTGANDPDCRKPMIWSDIKYENENIHPVTGYTRPEEKNILDHKLFEHYKKMIKIRNDNIELRRGTFKTIYKNDKQDIFGFLREFKDKKIIVILNNNSKQQKIRLKLNGNNDLKFFDILNDKTYDQKNKILKIKIKPKWAVILKKFNSG